VDIAWHRLFHAYGPATEAPRFLDALARDEILEVDHDSGLGWRFGGIPYSFVWSGLYAQGRLTPATVPAARIIASQIRRPGFGGQDASLRPAMLFFFREIARTALDVDDINELRDIASQYDEPASQEWLDEFLADPVPVHSWGAAQARGRPFLAAAVVACHDLVPELFDVAMVFLAADDPRTRQLAALAATTMARHPALAHRRPALVDHHVREAANEKDPYDRASLVLGIGELGRQPTEWLGDSHPGVQLCAAMAPRLADDPRALDILLQAARHPAAIDAIFGTMQLPQFDAGLAVALAETLCSRMPDFDALVTAAIAAVDSDGRWSTIDGTSMRLSGCAPYLRVGFAAGLPEAERSTSAQRSFAQFVTSSDDLWAADTTWRTTLRFTGLPDDRTSWANLAGEPDNPSMS